jgi:hypothetical protein
MPDGIELADAIKALRAELLTARADGARDDIQLPVTSLTLELKVVATRAADGAVGFHVPIINAKAGGSAKWEREDTQTVTIVFGAPLDSDGRPALIAHPSDEMLG